MDNLTFEFLTLGVEINVLLLVAVGFCAGTLAALFGIGGGILVTPFLNIFGAPMPLAVPTSINYITGTALVATVRNRKWGNVNIKAGLFTAAFMLPTVELSSQLMKVFAKLDQTMIDNAVRIGFLSFIVISTIAIVTKKEGGKPGLLAHIRVPPMITLGSHAFSLWAIALGGMLAGLIAGMLGLGGGRILVPLFLVVMSLGTKESVGTSSFVILISSLYGSVTYGLKGMVDYPAVVCLLAGSTIGAMVGSAALKAFPAKAVRYLYVFLSVAAMTSLALKQFHQPTIALIVLGGCCGAIVLAAVAYLLKGRRPRHPSHQP